MSNSFFLLLLLLLCIWIMYHRFKWPPIYRILCSMVAFRQVICRSLPAPPLLLCYLFFPSFFPFSASFFLPLYPILYIVYACPWPYSGHRLWHYIETYPNIDCSLSPIWHFIFFSLLHSNCCLYLL